MKDFDSLSDDEKTKYDQIVNLKLAHGDVEGILELLSWAQSTAQYLSEMEAVRGTPHSEVRLKTYAHLANNLIEFITETIKTGEPDYDKIN
jgi:hypothetical protein